MCKCLRHSESKWCSIQPTFCKRATTPCCGKKMAAVARRHTMTLVEPQKTGASSKSLKKRRIGTPHCGKKMAMWQQEDKPSQWPNNRRLRCYHILKPKHAQPCPHLFMTTSLSLSTQMAAKRDIIMPAHVSHF